MQKLIGYNRGWFELYDHKKEFERLLEVMTECDKERLWPALADSPARLIYHGVHFGAHLTPPPLFNRYIAPYYQELSQVLHERGKTLCFHGDDDVTGLLEPIKQAGFDMVECFVTAPQVRVTLKQAREVWGPKFIIWGGLPSIMLEPTVSDGEFESYMLDVFRTIAPGDAFMLGVADNVMPTAVIQRIEKVSELVDKYGHYPISVSN